MPLRAGIGGSVVGVSRSLFLCAILSVLAPAAATAAELIDATGRTVQAPPDAARVFPAGPPASVLLYVLKPEAMLGWTRAPADATKAYLLPSVHDLVALPRLTADDGAVDVAALTSVRPDLIVDFGSVTPRYMAQIERIQAESGVPSVLLDGGLNLTPAALRQLGAALGVAERAETLAAYADETLAWVDATLRDAPSDERPRVYLARGPDGLQSGGQSSINAEIIARAGAINVVDAGGMGNIVDVTLEQLLAWAPETIITLDRDFAGIVAGAPTWQAVPAVAAGRVLVAPSEPFGFIDSPPSVNRLIGLRWLVFKLYPEQAQGDLRAEVRTFYRLFYQVDLDDAALDRLLAE